MDINRINNLRLNETTHQILKIAATMQTLTIRDVQQRLDVKYAKANALFKKAISLGMLEELEGYGLECAITSFGRDVLKAIDNGMLRIKKDIQLHDRKTENESPVISTHDEIANEFIKEMAQPIALNSKINSCLGNIGGLTSAFLEEFPEIKTPVTDLDKHNASLYEIILSMHRQLTGNDDEQASA